ncbi:exopolysaccharide biosynthesis polyprenyl glycosylphosphotransferase [Faecalibacter rhinopitheci]|uniref:Exopolysaccharide biosynthesis polyprenyl glycosylphosphotransferase n=1 Tax=Faecalibacter rhinopitheci TaxID=2779678 RepID=A0A8J7FNG5_9FLAO|nr:exopolysaccharide biosynthesis polyprenyl glycosylphosphotransferase [Faecalibacter rhinopitheci]MBF0597697.1 exopolysaccharide biosynthesis polyprenyl glycosylphosphotransferase [Faecalibacter rhinopitheci]
MQYKNKKNANLRFLNILLDFSLLSLLFIFFLYLHYPNWERSVNGLKILLLVQYKSFLIFIFSWFVIAEYVKYYLLNENIKLGNVFKKSIVQSALFSIILFAISGIKDENLYSNFETLGFSIVIFIYVLVSRLLFYIIIQIRLNNGYYLKNAILIGENKISNSFLETLQSQKLSVFLEKIYTNESFVEEEYLNHLRNPKLDIIYLSLNSGLDERQIDFILYNAQNKYKKVEFISDTFMDYNNNLEINYYETFPVLSFSRYPLDFIRYQVLKRLFDICFSLAVLFFLVPFVYPLIALFIYIDSGFPILYKQKRNGLFGKEFLCLKFRTMKPNKDNDIKATVRGDSRITEIGRILRKTSLDELPQFINVLKGEMSIVGPRPHMISQDAHYAKIINEYTLRHYVKPGITGLAQVKGYRGEINSDRDMELRIMTDIFYVRNWSFYMDIVIIIKTVFKMFLGDKNAI